MSSLETSALSRPIGSPAEEQSLRHADYRRRLEEKTGPQVPLENELEAHRLAREAELTRQERAVRLERLRARLR